MSCRFDVAANRHIVTSSDWRNIANRTSEEIVRHQNRVTAGSKRDGMRGVAPADEGVAPDCHMAITTTGLVGREIQFGILLLATGQEAASTAAWIVLTLRRIVDEDVIGQSEIARLVDPGAPSSVAKSVSCDSDIFTGLLDADHSRTIRAIDDVSRDDCVLAELRQKERSHAGTDDLVVTEDDPLRFLNVHRVA